MVYLIIVLVMSAVIVVGALQKKPGPNPTLQQILLKPYGTLTTLVDTLLNTWTFQLNRGNLELAWTPLAGTPMTIWDSQYGVCNHSQSLVSFSSAVGSGDVEYLNSGIVLGQTPMYIDELGIQRTFQLKMYSGDVRIESTNGERAKNGGLLSPYPLFWSIWSRDITGLTDYSRLPSRWPLSFSGDVIWQNVDSNFGYAAQFLTSGNLVTHYTYNSDNFFEAANFVQPICSTIT